MGKLYSLLSAVFLIFFGSSVWGANSDWRIGQNLKVTYSANDALCREMLEYYDGKFRMKFHAFREKDAYDNDSRFMQWQKVSSGYDTFDTKFFDAEFDNATYGAEFDIDSDGEKELVIRTTYNHKGMWLSDSLAIMQSKTLDWYKKQKWTRRKVVQQSNTILPRDIKPEFAKSPWFRLRHHPDYRQEYDQNRTMDTPLNPSIDTNGLMIDPFLHSDGVYLSFIISTLDKATQPTEHWGVIARYAAPEQINHICYFNLQFRQFRGHTPN